MSQRVPSWDIDGPPPFPSYTLPLHHYRPSGSPLGSLHIRSQYEMAELTWENGQLALHGLVRPCTGKPAPKSPSTSVVAVPSTSWNKHHPSGTLESVVNQVTGATPRSPDLEDWLGGLGRSASVAVDALVPCRDDVAVDGRKRALVAGVCSSQGSAAGSLAGRVDSTTPVTLDMWREDDLGLTATTSTTATATNSASPETENTSPSKRKAPALDDHVSISYTSSQTKHDSLYDEEDKGSRREGKKPFASKKSRAAAIHNQSERKRRDKINQRMKTLQKMVPNSSKTDKASMLDEVIEYLKQLQAQVQVMSNMMMPMAVPLMPHIPQVPQTAMAIGTMMDVASMGRSMPATLPLLHPTTLLPLAAPLPDPYSSLLAPRMAQFLQRPMSLEEYSRMAAWIHPLLQHNPPADPKS